MNKERERRYLRWYGNHIGMVMIAMERQESIAKKILVIAGVIVYVGISYLAGIPISIWLTATFTDTPASFIEFQAVSLATGILMTTVLFIGLHESNIMGIFESLSGIRTAYQEARRDYGRKGKDA